jgi:hypothetical protein
MHNYDRIEIYAKTNEKRAVKRLARKKGVTVSRLLLDSVLGEVPRQ